MREIIFYKNSSGQSLVKDFINQKTPPQEIALAEQRKKEYQEGKKHG